MNRSMLLLGNAVAVLVSTLTVGCANMTVTAVKDGDTSTKGLRYYLPKPYLQATPQADGTVNVDVIFLPDTSRSYAIDTSSYLSSYTFQAARDEKGLLTALEFKASTAAVGQQLASSAGTYATQAYNVKAAGAVAQQIQVNAAQTALDTARSTRAAAEATLASDLAHGAKTDTITADYAAVAGAKVKAEIAEQALQRAQTTAQLVSTTVSASTPITTTPPSAGTAFGQPVWNPPVVVSLPQQFGPVLYAVNDDGKTVALVAVKAKLDGTESSAGLQTGVLAAAQPAFKTTSAALGPPSLVPTSQTQPTSSRQATFVFDRPVRALSLGSSVVTDSTPPVVIATAVPKLSADGKAVTVDTTGMKAGNYLVTVVYSFVVDPSGALMSANKQLKLTLTP